MEVIFWLTDYCNMSCSYCYERNKAKKYVMNRQIITSSISLIEKYAVETGSKELTIGFHGGEPMLEYDLIQFAVNSISNNKLLSNLRINYGMTTNGTLFDNNRIDFISNNVSNVSVSIDGIKETHDRNRLDCNGNRTFDTVKSAILKLIKKNPYIRLRMTITRDTVCNLSENIMFLVSMGGKIISPAIDFIDKTWNLEDMIALENELKRTYDILKSRELLEHVVVSMIMTKGNDITPKNPCSFGKDNFVIYADGNLYPCISTAGEEEFRIGTINSGINVSLVKQLLKYNSDVIHECSGCSFYKYCDAIRCKLLNKLYCGNYNKPSEIECMQSNVLNNVMLYTSK